MSFRQLIDREWTWAFFMNAPLADLLALVVFLIVVVGIVVSIITAGQ